MFTKELEDGSHSHVPAYFTSKVQDIDGARDVDLEAIASVLSAQVEHFNSRGSNFTIEKIMKFVVCITKFRPLHGSSYIETPKCLQSKHCIVNVHNYDDKCFVWAILSAIHPPSLPNAQRVSYYLKYQSELKTDNLVFPITTKDIPKFKSMNPQISVNVLAFGSNEREFCIEYLSPHRDRAHHVNLFVIEENGKHHYVWIKDMSRLVAGRTNHHGATHVCNSCLHPFRDKIVLEPHIPYCLRHPPQVVKYPNPENEDECTIKFRGHHKQHRIPFYLVCDFESFLSPANDEEVNNSRGTHEIQEHHISGFACYRVTDNAEYQTEPTVYSGPEPMTKFYEHVMSESKVLGQIIASDEEMKPLTPEQQAEYDQAK